MSNYRIFITPAALLDLEEAVEYYNSKADKLGDKLAVLVDNSLLQIANLPTAYGYRYKDVRGKFLKRFPYLILFRIDEPAKTIQVVRIFNTYQNPERYKG